VTPRDVPVSGIASEDAHHEPTRAAWWLAAGAGLVAALVALLSIRAWLAGTNDADSMATVLYFQRILSGQHLEVTVLTTPKPLLTVIYGVTWSLFHDWRAIVWQTIAIHALGVALATRLAVRLAGIPAGVFVAVALIASSTELAEVSQANSLPWALAGWAIAGLAITSQPRRLGLAGVALGLAGMVRIETWVILAAGTLGIALLAVPAVRSRAPSSWPSVRSTFPLLMGWLAVPTQLLHDALLTGNPLYWLSVPSAYTALVTPHLAPVGPLHFARQLLDRYAAVPWIVLLAVIGFEYLFRRRRWGVLLGLTGLVAGVWVLLSSLAMRAIFVSDRYYEEPKLGLLFAAGIGVGALARVALQAPNRFRPAVGVAAWAASAVIALLLSLPGPLTPELAQRMAGQQVASYNLESVMPRVRGIMSHVQGPAPPPITGERGFTRVNPLAATIFVPRPLQRRIAIELGVPLTRLADSTESFRFRPAADLLSAGQFVYHDARIDAPPALFQELEITGPAQLGSVHLVPIVYRPGAYWLLAVDP
jgi:hypothetical protein